MSKNDDTVVQADVVEDVSPHNKALYEAGKSLLVESIGVGREFCKFMTTTALSAIPIYHALLKLVLPKDYVLQSHDEVVFLAPPVLFLVSSVVFVLGYFPQRGRLSLDLPAEIDRELTGVASCNPAQPRRVPCSWISSPQGGLGLMVLVLPVSRRATATALSIDAILSAPVC